MRLHRHHVRSPRRAALAVLAGTFLLCACNPREWKTPNMTALTPRLQAIFEKTETVCFGRFMIDLPQGTQVAWGRPSVPLSLTVYPGEASKLAQVVAEREAELKAEERFPAGSGLTLYIETLQGAKPDQRTIVSYEDFISEGRLKMDSYFSLIEDLIKLNARPLLENKARAVGTLNGMAARLRPRQEEEIPPEPGVCLERTFLADPPAKANKPDEIEHIRVGFRLKAFPDVHLSIYTAPANRYDTQARSLKRQFDETRSMASKSGLPDPFSSLKFFRDAPRTIHDWTTGYEVLTRSPEQKKARSYHEFWMKFTGVAHDALHPFADIKLETGVEDDIAGAILPSLTDEEVVALWDRLTSTIRLRPTGVEPAKKTSDAGPLLPLGDLAATGRTCPQTGVWECVDEGDVQGGRRKSFRVGEVMPGIGRPVAPTLWQKLKGESPTYRSGTVWKLIGYDAAPDA